MGFWSRLRKTFSGENQSAEIEDELQLHLEMERAEGRIPRDAVLRLGNVTRIKEDTRTAGIVEWLDSALRDTRCGLRQLRRTPVLASVIVLSLAIGIGANTAIFSLVDAAILKPLPVRDPDSLRIVEWTNGGFPEGVENINGDFEPIAGGRVQGSSVAANIYRRLAHEQTGFEALVGVADPGPVAVAIGSSQAEQVSLQYVSDNFFQDLGVSPAVGRSFLPGEDAVGREPVVVLSHRLWISRFGGGSALDRIIRINNVPSRVVGVAPAGFFGLTAGEWTDVYTPLAARVVLQANGNDRSRGENDRDWWIRQIGRLKPGVTETAAKMQLAALFHGLTTPEGTPVDPKKIPELITLPGRRGVDAVHPEEQRALWTLMLLVGVLLLMVCVNVANLLLSRSMGRERESAVRLALGAGRLRLFRQHLIESTVFALIGGAAGLALGYGFALSIHRLFESGRAASSAFDLHPDWRVLGYTAATSILTSFLFGLAPAVRSSRAAINDAMKAQTRSIVGGRSRFGARLPRALVSVQIALCLTTLVAAGLLVRSLQNLKLVDIGFDRENLAYVTVNPSQAGYDAGRLGPYIDRLRAELMRLPGVLRVSPIEVRPLSGNGNASLVCLPGRSYKVDQGVFDAERAVTRNHVGEGFLETFRVPLLAGRMFNSHDARPNANVVVVDELFARRFLSGGNPVGRRFGFNIDESTRYEIVGVVRRIGYNTLRDAPIPAVYEPLIAGEMRGAIHIAIRAAIDSGRLGAAVRQAVAAVDPSVPVTEFHTQTGLIDRLLQTERLLSFLSGAFSVVALTLAAVGLGGLLSYAVARRTNEIGLRMAIGATAADVTSMVLRESLWMVGAGIFMGLPCAWIVGRVLGSALFGIRPVDPLTGAVSVIALIGIALLASWAPAHRAARIDPMSALREE